MNTTEMGAFCDEQSAATGPDMALMCEYMAHAIKKSSQQRMLAQQPLEVRKRIRALRKIQLQTTNLEAEFHRLVYDLERKQQYSHALLYEKRSGIINGTYEPTDEECDFPDPPPVDDDTLMFLENTTLSQRSDQQDETAAAVASAVCTDASSLACGVPHFWLSIFKYGPMFEMMVKPTDEPALKHLSDIQVHIYTLPEMSFQLRFCFTPNEYFSDEILMKEYLLKCEPDGAEPFAFDGPEIYGCRGCVIHWKEGMDLTQRLVRRKGPPVDGDAEAPNAAELRKTDTFFNFFDPPELPESGNHPEYDAINKCMQRDFEIGHYLKERIVPRAVLYYTGENDDDFDDSDDGTSDSSAGDSVHIHEAEAELIDAGDGDVVE